MRITMLTALLLHVDIDAKARDAGHGDREIALHLALELVALAFVHHRVGERAGHLGDSACWSVSGFMLPFDFMLGGKSLAMKRSEPPAWLIAVEQLVHVGAGLFFGQGGHVSPSALVHGWGAQHRRRPWRGDATGGPIRAEA